MKLITAIMLITTACYVEAMEQSDQKIEQEKQESEKDLPTDDQQKAEDRLSPISSIEISPEGIKSRNPDVQRVLNTIASPQENNTIRINNALKQIPPHKRTKKLWLSFQAHTRETIREKYDERNEAVKLYNNHNNWIDRWIYPTTLLKGLICFAVSTIPAAATHLAKRLPNKLQYPSTICMSVITLFGIAKSLSIIKSSWNYKAQLEPVVLKKEKEFEEAEKARDDIFGSLVDLENKTWHNRYRKWNPQKHDIDAWFGETK